MTLPTEGERPGGQPGRQRNSASPGDGAKHELSSVILQRQHRQATVTKPVYGLAPIDPIHYAARMLQDCIDQQTVQFWLRRADEWDSIDPFVSLQCKRHAWILEQVQGGEISDEVRSVVAEIFMTVPEREAAGVPRDLYEPAPRVEARAGRRRNLRAVA